MEYSQAPCVFCNWTLVSDVENKTYTCCHIYRTEKWMCMVHAERETERASMWAHAHAVLWLHTLHATMQMLGPVCRARGGRQLFLALTSHFIPCTPIYLWICSMIQFKDNNSNQDSSLHIQCHIHWTFSVTATHGHKFMLKMSWLINL
jgi:hypothetical protein